VPIQDKVKDFEGNYMFNKFHHLFEYDATYYSYLIAKIASQRLFAQGVRCVDGKHSVSKELLSLFERGAMYRLH
jgi:Zn-dependent oligopeptidase